MQPEITKTDAFYLVGRHTSLQLHDPNVGTAIEEFNNSFDKQDSTSLLQHSNNRPKRLLQVNDFGGVSRTEADTLNYWRAVAADAPIDGWEQREVAPAYWAVFPIQVLDSKHMSQVWTFAATRWFKDNPYNWAPGLEIVAVHPREAAEASLWLPVKAQVSA